MNPIRADEATGHDEAGQLIASQECLVERSRSGECVPSPEEGSGEDWKKNPEWERRAYEGLWAWAEETYGRRAAYHARMKRDYLTGW